MPIPAERNAQQSTLFLIEIMEDLKRENILTHSDHPEPLPEIRPVQASHAAHEDSMPVITGAEQLSLFESSKPSVLAQLADAKRQPKEAADPAPKKEMPER